MNNNVELSTTLQDICLWYLLCIHCEVPIASKGEWRPDFAEMMKYEINSGYIDSLPYDSIKDFLYRLTKSTT